MLSDLFEHFKEQVAAARRSEKWLPMIATAGDEVLLAASMKAAANL
jgi:hypothetical protein